jgi:CRISPR system Cascade subunit CasA
MVEGRTLRETLLLNLIPDDSPYVRSSDGDVPVWERAPQTACEEVEGGRQPCGRLDLYTWQSGRLRLFGDQAGITGVIVANGDPLQPHNRFGVEPMSAWRRSRPQEKKLNTTPVYLPREHDPERAIWRGLAALLPGSHGRQGKEAAEALPPAVLRWIGQAYYTGELTDDQLVRTRAVGMRYGKNQSTTIEIIDDAVDMSLVLLAETSRELATTAVTAAGDAERGARAYGHLAVNLASAAGGDKSDPKHRALKEKLAREQAYAALDAPFRSWLAQLGAGTDPLQAHWQWHQTARRILLNLGRELVAQAGPVAWVGRQSGPPDNRRHVSSPEADIWFRREIRKAYPLAYEPERTGVQP